MNSKVKKVEVPHYLLQTSFWLADKGINHQTDTFTRWKINLKHIFMNTNIFIFHSRVLLELFSRAFCYSWKKNNLCLTLWEVSGSHFLAYKLYDVTGKFI